MADEYPDEAARKRINSELDAIDKAHAAVMRRCSLCGQLTAGLDDFGLCSKVSITHTEVRGDFAPKTRKR
jgi:hypothetical protein